MQSVSYPCRFGGASTADWTAAGAQVQTCGSSGSLVALGLLPVAIPLLLQAPDEGVEARRRALPSAHAVLGSHGLQLQHQVFVWGKSSSKSVKSHINQVELSE